MIGNGWGFENFLLDWLNWRSTVHEDYGSRHTNQMSSTSGCWKECQCGRYLERHTNISKRHRIVISCTQDRA